MKKQFNQRYLALLLLTISFAFGNPVSPFVDNFPIFLMGIVVTVVCLIVECIIEFVLLNRYNIISKCLVPAIIVANILSYAIAYPFLLIDFTKIHWIKLIIAEILIVLFETAVILFISRKPNCTGPEGNKLPIVSAFFIMLLGNVVSFSISFAAFWKLAKLIKIDNV